MGFGRQWKRDDQAVDPRDQSLQFTRTEDLIDI